VEDWAALAERKAWEWVSRVEVDNVVVLPSACEGAEGLARRITLLEGELVETRRTL
jgi:hypothetical protein